VRHDRVGEGLVPSQKGEILSPDKSGPAMTAASPWAETDGNGIIPIRMEAENGKDSLDI